MQNITLYHLLADLILILHTLFAGFVVSGLIAIIIGGIRGWQWVRNPWFRLAHLVAIVIVALQAWLGILCPLTTLEMTLRAKAGDSIYEGSFIAHWLEYLLYYEVTIAENQRDIWYYSAEDNSSTLLVGSTANERAPGFSPDGNWVVYLSDKSGKDEIYVKPFPSGTGERQISNDGGSEPVWSPKGNEIFYRNGDKMMSAVIVFSPALRVIRRVELFEEKFQSSDFRASYDVHPDGNKFIIIEAEEETDRYNMFMIKNWFEELKRLAPVKKN